MEVAADSSATAEAPANEGEGTADAGEVELAPWTGSSDQTRRFLGRRF